MNETLVSVQKLTKSFDTAAEHLIILDSLDLDIPVRSKTVILGESGCGKSTLLNIIGGLESPSSGSVISGSFRVDALDEHDLARYRGSFIGLVFQFHYLLKDFTALENVMLPAYMQGMKKKYALERARQLLSDVHLDTRMNHFPSQMSGGERQRAAVARALINQPPLVLADEPTGNLDPANSAMVMEILFSVVTTYGSTLIMVTHDQSTTALAESAYQLIGGKLVKQ